MIHRSIYRLLINTRIIYKYHECISPQWHFPRLRKSQKLQNPEQVQSNTNKMAAKVRVKLCLL
jgi:hypothetical protein